MTEMTTPIVVRFGPGTSVLLARVNPKRQRGVWVPQVMVVVVFSHRIYSGALRYIVKSSPDRPSLLVDDDNLFYLSDREQANVRALVLVGEQPARISERRAKKLCHEIRKRGTP